MEEKGVVKVSIVLRANEFEAQKIFVDMVIINIKIYNYDNY